MSLDKPTIYVIDDDPSFLSAVSRLIRTSGYAVESLRSLGEFEAMLPLSEPSCVLADVILAGESGLRWRDLGRARTAQRDYFHVRHRQ